MKRYQTVGRIGKGIGRKSDCQVLGAVSISTMDSPTRRPKACYLSIAEWSVKQSVMLIQTTSWYFDLSIAVHIVISLVVIIYSTGIYQNL